MTKVYIASLARPGKLAIYIYFGMTAYNLVVVYTCKLVSVTQKNLVK